MDSEQKLRFFSSSVLLVTALCLAFVVYVYLDRPWQDTREMVAFQANRDLIGQIAAGEMVCMRPIPENTFFNNSALYGLNLSYG